MEVWRFGAFELQADARKLLLHGRPVDRLGARAFDVLLALVRGHEGVVGRDALMEAAWPGLVVEANNLDVQISSLRRLLGRDAVATVPSRGYRFTLALQPPSPAPQEALPVAAAPAAGPARPWLGARDGLAPLPARWDGLIACEPWLLAAQGEPAAMAAATAVVQALDGRPRASPGNELLVEMPSARAGIACAQRLHTLGAGPAAWRIALCGAQAGQPPEHALAQARELAAQVPPGQVWLSAEVAAQLIPNVDGDVHDLGAEHAARFAPGQRLYRLGDAACAPCPPTALAPLSTELRPTLAVLPFGSYALDIGPLRLGDVLADQLTSAISLSHALNVISRLSTLPFRDREAPASLIGQALGAQYIVSGRYFVSAGQLHLNAELAEAASGRVVWMQRLQDRSEAALHPGSDLLQALVAGVTQALFLAEVRKLRNSALPTLASHTLLLAAISLLYRLSQRDFQLAHDALQELSQRAPHHAAPYAWLARWHLFRVVQGWTHDRQADGRLALDFARKALDYDPDSTLAMTMVGNVHTNVLHNLEAAEDWYDRALALNPNESLAWLQKGNALSFHGRGAEALVHTEKALSLSPLDPARHFYLALTAGAALAAGEWARAAQAARESLRLNQEHASAHRVLTIALVMLGELEEARLCARRLQRLEPGYHVGAFVARAPAADPAMVERFAQALRRAGVPHSAPLSAPPSAPPTTLHSPPDSAPSGNAR